MSKIDPDFKLSFTHIVLVAAISAHSAIKQYSIAAGDFSHDDWGKTASELKENTMSVVCSIYENPHQSAEEIHNVWMSEKIKSGWKYGDAKNKHLKEHPCIIPYADLSKMEKKKDSLFKSIVISVFKEFLGDNINNTKITINE